MKKVWIIVIFIISVAFLTLAVLFIVGYFKPKLGGILVSTIPNSSVFINGKLVGKTPYEGAFEQGDIKVELVPESGEKKYITFKTKATLVSGVKTVIRHEFGESNEKSSGEIISFEKEAPKGISLVVVSFPDNAQVVIDGVPKGFSPYKISMVSPGEHKVSVKAIGYLERTLTVKTLPGY